MSSKTIVNSSVTAKKPLATPQTKVGEYELLKKIGSGSYGKVYKARCLRTGRLVAVKMVSLDQHNYYRTKQVLRELSILRQLSALKGSEHHIVRLLDAWRDKNNLFMVLELFESTLKRYLDKCSDLQPGEDHVIKMVYSLLCSLHFLHSAGLMHRDIKPSNLLVASDLSLRICDFGLAREVVEEAPLNFSKSLQRRRLSNHVCTRFYRPPEVILLEKHYDTRADLWSAGCIALEIISCQKQYIQDATFPSDRMAFHGTACHPLSPQKNSSKGDQDQLRMILEVLGKQSTADQQFITNQDAKDYVDHLSEGCEGQKVNFELEFEGSDPRLAQILQKSLEFNPHRRASAAALLQNSVFDSVRNADLERPADARVRIEVDELDEFDYSKNESATFTVANLLKMMDSEREEVCQINWNK